jgi:hypothetical protein
LLKLKIAGDAKIYVESPSRHGAELANVKCGENKALISAG